jgi:hypothetical protein
LYEAAFKEDSRIYGLIPDRAFRDIDNLEKNTCSLLPFMPSLRHRLPSKCLATLKNLTF